MSSSTVDTALPATPPPTRSVEAYLEAERVTLAQERLAADTRESTTKRWTLLRSAGLGLALAGTIAFGWNHLNASEPTARFCTADGYTTASGETLTRDNAQGCAWVDSDGKLVPVDADGQPKG